MRKVWLGHNECIEIIPANTPLHFGISRHNFIALAQGNLQECMLKRLCRDTIGKMNGLAGGQQRIHGHHIVHHLAVADRAGTTGVVSCHATDGAAAGR